MCHVQRAGLQQVVRIQYIISPALHTARLNDQLYACYDNHVVG
jgi:hypothetical protein